MTGYARLIKEREQTKKDIAKASDNALRENGILVWRVSGGKYELL